MSNIHNINGFHYNIEDEDEVWKWTVLAVVVFVLLIIVLLGCDCLPFDVNQLGTIHPAAETAQTERQEV